MISDFSQRRIRAQVESQLSAGGQFDPLQLLISSGRISHQSLTGWKNDPQDRLEDQLLGEASSIVAEISAAANHAQALGLVPVSTESNDTAIAFDNQELSSGLSVIWQKDPEERQLDLFFDNQGTQALNRLRANLVAGAAADALEALQQFEASDPNNKLLGTAARLVTALEQLNNEPDALPVQEWGENIPGPIKTGAHSVLGSQSGLFLKPFWCYLAKRLDKSPTIPAQSPSAAEAWVAAAEWERAITSVNARREWAKEAQSCRLLLTCLQQMGAEAKLLGVLFQCCWQHAEVAEEWLDHANNHAWLNQSWETFSDLDKQLPMSEFPAWISLAQQRSRQAEIDLGGATPSYRLIRAGLDSDDHKPLRKALLQDHRHLFDAVYRE